MLKKGFSLIELMVSVAIIGILAKFAIPAYNNFINKARFAEGIQNLAPVKTWVSTCVTMDDCAPTQGGGIFTATLLYPSESHGLFPNLSTVGYIWYAQALDSGSPPTAENTAACIRSANRQISGLPDSDVIMQMGGTPNSSCESIRLSVPPHGQNGPLKTDNLGQYFSVTLLRTGNSMQLGSAQYSTSIFFNAGCAANSKGIGTPCESFNPSDSSQTLTLLLNGTNYDAMTPNGTRSSMVTWSIDSSSSCKTWPGGALC